MRYDVDSLMHEDEKFVLLSDAAQALWTLLLTGPQRRRIPGLQYVTIATLAGIRRRTPEQVTAAMQELVDAGMVRSDERARVLLLPNQPFFNTLPNGNMIKGWFTDWRGIPESSLKHDFVAILRGAIDFKSGKGFDDRVRAWGETFGSLGARPKKGTQVVLPGVLVPVLSGQPAEERVTLKEGKGYPPSEGGVKKGPETLSLPADGEPSVLNGSAHLSSSAPLDTATVPKGFRNPLDLDRSSLGMGSDLDLSGEGAGRGSTKTACPGDLWDRMPETTKATLDTCMVPRSAQEYFCRGFAARYTHRDTGHRTFDEWVSSAVRAIQSDWNDPKKRPPAASAPRVSATYKPKYRSFR